MAKMFYTLEEAAERLGRDQQSIKDMASEGRIQQFRDQDRLMFKREQVDGLAAENEGGTAGGEEALSSGTGVESLSDTNTMDPAEATGPQGSPQSSEDSGPIPLAEGGGDTSSDTDAIDLSETSSTEPQQTGGTRDETGVNVFDSDEVEDSDPMAQTQVSQATGTGDVSGEGVGSGSGLLDLTRESDDTSLGAELLDEIYPKGGQEGQGEGQGEGENQEQAAVGSSGVFEGGAAAGETGQSGPSGLEGLSDSGESAPAPALPAGGYAAAEERDPAGSGLGAGLLAGTTVALVLCLIVAIASLSGVSTVITGTMAASTGSLLLWCLGLLLLSIVLGIIGLFVGRTMG